MAVFTYVQTDTSTTFNVGCSGQTTGTTTGGRQALPSGTAGSTPITLDPGNNVTRGCFVFYCNSAPNVASWAAGDYVIPVNHPSMDGGTILSRVDVCDFNGSTYQTVASNTSPGHTRGASGIVTVTVNRGTSYSPQSQTLSRVFVVLTYNNSDAHGSSTFEITPNQTITTPIVVPVAPATPSNLLLLGVGGG